METLAQPKKVIYPYFEKGFPLRSRDLNAVFRRAEEEVRHTRTCLQGMGIFYGLQVSLTMVGDNPVIRVKAGAGVTSAGYLYCSHTDVVLSAVKTNSGILKRQFSTESFGEYLDAPALSEAEKGEQTLQVTELVTQGKPEEVSPLTHDELPGKRLLVFFEVTKTTLSGCASCEKGTQADLEVKYLLVDDNNWNKLTTGEKPTLNCGTTGNGNQANDLSPALLRLPRLGLNDGCISFGDELDLTQGYAAIINGHLEDIKNAAKTTLHLADIIFSLNGEATANALVLPGIAVINAQYVHDYLRLIIRAYNEFVSAPFARSFASLPPETCFPKHLVLGKFPAEGASLVLTDEGRTLLYRPPFDDATDADFDQAKKLYGRLISLLQDHDFANLSNKTALAMTPSRRACHPLGMQAIPFYLNADEVRKTWRPDSKFSNLILSYDNTSVLQHQPFFDEADFYRIEGHIGQALTIIDNENDDNKNQIELLRDCLNLPFAIVVVALNESSETFPTLSDFSRQYPGLEHQGGVPAGGTFVVLVSTNNDRDDQGSNLILGDFCLPYWVQLPEPEPKPVVADFIIKSQQHIQDKGASFVFVNTSQNYDHLEWRVNAGDTSPDESISLSDAEEFEHFFPLSEQPVKHYFVTLTAIKNEKLSVEKTTVVVLRNERQVPPPKADFMVQEQDNVLSSEDGSTITINRFSNDAFSIDLTFENLSENAADYAWEVDSKLLAGPTNKANLVHTFAWTKRDVERKSKHTVKLTAIQGDLSDFVQKTVGIEIIVIG